MANVEIMDDFVENILSTVEIIKINVEIEPFFVEIISNFVEIILIYEMIYLFRQELLLLFEREQFNLQSDHSNCEKMGEIRLSYSLLLQISINLYSFIAIDNKKTRSL